LNGIKKNEVSEDFSFFSDHPAKNNEEDHRIMTSKVGKPG
jgi:hypothetical protein